MDRRTLLTGSLAVAGLTTTAFPAFSRVASPAADYAAAARYSAERSGVSLLVMQGGQTLFEDYPRGGPDSFYELASGTKSFSGVMAAALVQDELLTLDEACADTLTEWRTDPVKRTATIRSLLSLESGAGGGRIGRPDTYAGSVAAPFAGPAGTFRYGPAPFQIFGEIVRRKLVAAGPGDDVLAWMQSRILEPAGLTVGNWRQRDGQPTLRSGAQLTARDWARFGLFVLDGGVVDGRATLDTAALAANFQPSAANPGYGMSWWLLQPGLIPPSDNSRIDAAPAKLARLPDVRMAAGAGNQRLYLVPERDLLIVRQADGILRQSRGQGSAWSDPDFLALLLS
ncbi:MAG: serine hydrolase [Alphaproteobacteria bacterium]|nr:MAG: serine hydrolase [Alphaproteobacteria bacterium]